MDKTKALLILIVVVLLVIVVPIAFEGKLISPISNEADIKIIVLDEFTNNPVREAKVSLDGGSETLTSSDGSITFSSVEFGEHRVRVEYKEQVKDETITVSLTENQFTITIPAPKTIDVKILDTETGNPVKNQEIYMDGKKIGSTTQNGDIMIRDVMPGTYVLSLDKVKTSPNTKLTVYATGDSYTVSVDMPNPLFTVAGKLESSMIPGNTNKATVEIANTGKISSEGTIAVVLEYQEEPFKLIDKDIISFGEIPATGIPVEKESRALSNPWLVYEDVVIVVFDKNEYIPERDWSVQLSVPKDAISSWVSQSMNYCNQNAKDCAEIAGIFAGTLIKTALA